MGWGVLPGGVLGTTTHHCGAKSAGARMSHSSVSGSVKASKEKRGEPEFGEAAVKLGGQQNGAAPARRNGVLSTLPGASLGVPSPRAPHPVPFVPGSSRAPFPCTSSRCTYRRPGCPPSPLGRSPRRTCADRGPPRGPRRWSHAGSVQVAWEGGGVARSLSLHLRNRANLHF